MHLVVTPACPEDLPVIFTLFEEAIFFQRSRNYIGWSSFDKEFIQIDVQQGFLYKMVGYGDIIGIFCICFNDLLIWRELERGDSLYMHRIVLNQKYKGQKIFEKVLNWAVALAGQKGFKYIRIDTWAENNKIIAYYLSYGFHFIENYTTPDTPNLPEQHRNLKVALLQFDL